MDPVIITITDVDEALEFAVATRKRVRDSRKPLIQEFIDDLLDARLELSK